MSKNKPRSKRSNFDNPDLPLAELMSDWPQTIPVFVRHDMLCVGCMIGPFHTVIDACLEYELDETRFRQELADAINFPASPDQALQVDAADKR